jgi:hypothetical protein
MFGSDSVQHVTWTTRRLPRDEYIKHWMNKHQKSFTVAYEHWKNCARKTVDEHGVLVSEFVVQDVTTIIYSSTE